MSQENSCKVDYAGTLHSAPGNNREANGYSDFVHQNEAQIAMTKAILENEGKDFFSGLLVIPTGGGKTFIAAEWLLKNWLDKGKRVLWIAHRHELLEQAFGTFKKNCYHNLLPRKKSLHYRIISGQHDKAVRIQAKDDLIIASKDSLNKGANYLLNNWVVQNQLEELFLVIDEAHHATAKTYRKLINSLQEHIERFKILGLTATPFRTSEKEQGLLHKIFPDDIIHKTDLRTLISRNILAEPIFEETTTEWQAANEITDSDIEKIQRFDLPEEIKVLLASQKDRNNQIVEHYLANRDKYGQLLVFALNIDHAVALSALFNQKGETVGINSDFIVSGLCDGVTHVSLNKENREKLRKFRSGELNILVNMNIVSEGTDLPNVQSVFLTRPTISKILMTQMIGRALRGKKAGGTDQAYVVSFIDNWQDKISWINPEKLFIVDNVDFNETDKETEKRLVRLISIEKIAEFARIMDRTVDTNSLAALDFLDRIPVGIYAFSLLESSGDGENIERNCEVLVYNHMQRQYENFIESLPDFFEKARIDVDKKEMLHKIELLELSMKVESRFFNNARFQLGFEEKDIQDILMYYFDNHEPPRFIHFSERENYDIDKIAKDIYEKDLGPRDQGNMINLLWEDDKIAWKALFGFNKQYFVNEIGLSLQKMVYGHGLFQHISSTSPVDEGEERQYEDMSLSELREHAPGYHQRLSDGVYKKYTNKKGQYYSAISGHADRSKLVFEIDHIKPFSKGGKTRLDNLQLVTWWENRKKGDKE